MRKLLVALVCVTLLLFSTSIAWADSAGGEPVSLSQAVQMALKNSNTLRADSFAIDQAKYDRDAAAIPVTFTPTGPTTPQAEASFTRLQQAGLAWEMARKNYDADKDTVVMKVYQAYYGILQAQASLQSAQQAVDSADWQHRAAVVGYEVGTLSKADMIKADAGNTGAKAQLEAAKKALDDAYQKFNQLIGLMPSDRPVLSEQAAFTPLGVQSLDAEVSRVQEQSPSLWLAQRNVDLARLALDIYSYGPSEPHTYKATQIGVPIAEQKAASMQEQMDQLVRSLYYNIRQLEESYTGLQQSVAVDQENLRVAQVKYDAGMATRADVSAAQAKLAQDQQALANVLCQHQTLVQAFQTPWAYAVSMSGAGASASPGPNSSQGAGSTSPGSSSSQGAGPAAGAATGY